MVNRAFLILALGYLGAASWGAYEWQRTVSTPPTPQKQEDVSLPQVVLPTTFIGDIDVFDEFIERPPFTPTRRPSDTEGDGEEGMQPTIDRSRELASMRLTAILMDGDRTTALIEHNDGTANKLQVGSKFDNWEVKELRDDYAVLIGNGQRHMLMVHRFDAPAAQPARRNTHLANRRNSVPARPPSGPQTEPTDVSNDPDRTSTSSKEPAQ